MPAFIVLWRDYSLHTKLSIFAAVILSMLVAGNNVRSQGFDWEYSVRMPFEVPHVFVGPYLEYSFLGQSTDLKVLEQVQSLQRTFSCAQYDKGVGAAFSVGARVEWWKYSKISLIAQLGYSALSADFTATSPAATLIDGNILQTQYKLSTNVQSLVVEALIKARLGIGHAWTAGGIRSQTKMSSKSNLHERVLRPSSYSFPGTNVQDRLVSDADIDGLRDFYISPLLSIGYDLNMGRSCYSSFCVSASIPLMSYLSSTTWSIASLNFQYSLVFGIDR